MKGREVRGKRGREVRGRTCAAGAGLVGGQPRCQRGAFLLQLGRHRLAPLLQRSQALRRLSRLGARNLEPLRQRLEHFLAEPKTMLLLNGTLVNPGGAKALFDLMDEKLPPMVSEVKAPAEKV